MSDIDGRARRGRPLRSTFLTIAALATLLPGAAAADTPLGHSGRFGAHFLTDTEEYPGARCRFETGTETRALVGIRVRPPVIYARDRSDGRDEQVVGWRILVQRLDTHQADPTWEPFATTSVRYATAYDDQAASFAMREVRIDHVGGADVRYRVRVGMRWLAPGTPSVTGTARHGVDHVWSEHAASEPGVGRYCVGALLV
jgi:hypothetical protein